MYRGYATALLDCNGKEIETHGVYVGKRMKECLHGGGHIHGLWLMNLRRCRFGATFSMNPKRRHKGPFLSITLMASGSKSRTCPVHSLGILSLFDKGSDA